MLEDEKDLARANAQALQRVPVTSNPLQIRADGSKQQKSGETSGLAYFLLSFQDNSFESNPCGIRLCKY